MVTSGFFNAVNGDRTYSAEQMSAIFDGIINDGVFVNVGTAFAVTADVGNKVLVGPGRAWIDSTWIYNDTPLEVELEDSDILTDRIDAVVLETDHSAPVRMGSIKVVKGVAQTNPVKPTLEHSFYVNQYPIAYILRPKNSRAITQANITYTVGTSEIPFVTGILETLDIDALVAQWGAEWEEWFDEIKAATSGDIVEYQEAWDEWFQGVRDELSEDAAGNLQLQIDNLMHNQFPYIKLTSIYNAGWYRLFKVTTNRMPSPCDIRFYRSYSSNNNESGKLHFSTAYKVMRFSVTETVTNIQLIDGIRIVYNSVSNKVFMDLHYKGTTGANNVTVGLFEFLKESTPVWSKYEEDNYLGEDLSSEETVLTEYTIQPNISGDMSRFWLKRAGSMIGFGDIFAGNIDQLKPDSMIKPYDQCGTYICSLMITEGTVPTFPYDNTVQPPTDNLFFLVVDPVTNGSVQIAYPYTYSRMNAGDPLMAIRCLKHNNQWSAWQYTATSGNFLPLTGGSVNGQTVINVKDGIALIIGDNENYPGQGWIGARLAFQRISDNIMALLCTFNGVNWDKWISFDPEYFNVHRILKMPSTQRIRFVNENGTHFFDTYCAGTDWIGYYDSNHVFSMNSQRILSKRNFIVEGTAGLYHEDSYNKFTIFDPIDTNHYWQKMIGKTGVGLYRYALREVYNNVGKIAYYIANSSYSSDQLFSFHMEFYGSIGATAFEKDSSCLIKENIESLSEEDAKKVLDLRPVTFDFIESYGGAKGRIGLIAEEVVEVFPSVVSVPDEIDVENGKVPSIEYSELIAPLIKLVQMQQNRIDEQDRKIEDLESRLAQVEKLLNKL